MLTISKRKSWAVYATHSDISKSLQRPFRKVEHIIPTVRKWLAQATVPSHHTIVPANQIAPDASQAEADHSSVASTLTASFLDANPELGELSIVEVDGVVMVTATHEDTLYTMERCYSSWDLAKRDLIRWMHKLEQFKGSSRLHVIADIGIAGKLKIRERGCHQPGCPCWTGMYEQCAHIPREGSLGLAEASHPLLSHTVSIEKDGNASMDAVLCCSAPPTRIRSFDC